MSNMKNLKKLRQLANKTQLEVSNAIGCSYVSYSHYENGRREPDFETLKKLANYFEVTTDYLLDADDKIMLGINNMFRSFVKEIKKTSLSIEEISELSGVEKQTISKILNFEAGDIQYDDYIAIAIALKLRFFGARIYTEEIDLNDKTKTLKQKVAAARANPCPPDELQLADDEYLVIGRSGKKEVVKMSPEFKSYLDSLQPKGKQKR